MLLPVHLTYRQCPYFIVELDSPVPAPPLNAVTLSREFKITSAAVAAHRLIGNAYPQDYRGPARNALLPAVPTAIAAASARARAISSATSTTAFMDFTSWTRTRCAPCRMAAVTAAALANSV